ncbi:3-hydroxybutyrate dehydrogenase [Cupriavidus basilensis OR16]|uniref:3-hydroxybutyrate dehydrogenase n=1 Tax=Cupriavidus basilensis OR16 TaxID=1127483 RepID=H1SIS6_9BURK|nr:3-hydroxybutyrate dehydrogenase [Cupriavidus basilensis OR16]
MTQRLAGKLALVTAAGQGIGRATAEAYLREGARVIAADINEHLLEALAGQPGCTTLRLDVTDGAAVQAAATQAGALDILFNGAGFVHHGTILECDEAAFDFSLNLNVRAIRLPARHGGAAQRLDRQHGVGGRQHQGRAQPLRLRRHQGGGDRHDQVGGGGLHRPRHPLQRDLPRHGGVALAAPAHRGPGARRGQEPCRGGGRLRGASADGAHRQRRRDRRAGGVPRLG